MTPQGLSDALSELVSDLPGHRDKVSESWQRVLTVQVLNRVLDHRSEYSPGRGSPALMAMCGIARSTVLQAVKQLLREEPALRQALAVAFDHAEASHVRNTDFCSTAIGELVDYATHETWHEIDAPYPEEVEVQSAGPTPPEPVA